jgi:hypothetical protein
MFPPDPPPHHEGGTDPPAEANAQTTFVLRFAQALGRLLGQYLAQKPRAQTGGRAGAPPAGPGSVDPPNAPSNPPGPGPFSPP